MGLTTQEPHSTPRLSLSKPPFCKARSEPQTPPLRPSVSIPFHWEEAPGKPRPTAAPSSSKCLELPPRLTLLHEEPKITIMPSPTSVLDGPHVGPLACSFSFRKGVGPGTRNLGSGRWGSERKFCRESFGISQSLGEIFRREDNHVKMARVRRRRSFFSLSTINSNSKYLWGEIFASFKQAVPWRRNP